MKAGFIGGYTCGFMADVTSPPYANAPLALVVVEIRYPPESVESVLTSAMRRAIRDRLGQDWVINDARVTELKIGEMSSGNPIREIPATRFMARDRMTSVTIRPGAMAVETTAYPGFSSFLPIVEAAVSAVNAVIVPDAVTRVGLRYIDEIVVSGMSGKPFEAWRDWLIEPLLPPQPPPINGVTLAQGPWSGMASYVLDEERSLNLRWGHNPGPVVAGDGPLRRPHQVSNEPAFILDFDCAWNPANFPEFEPSEIVRESQTLHAPMHELFESLITPRLRNNIFMREPT